MLIDALLQLSRVGRSQLSIAPTDVSAIAHEVAARLLEAHADRRIEFEIQPDLSVRGDRRLLEIVLTNLFENAVKFTRTRDQAEIALRPRRDRRCRGLLRARQWRRFRHGLRRRTLRSVQAPAPRLRFCRDRHRTGHRPAHRHQASGPGVGDRHARRRRNLLFHVGYCDMNSRILLVEDNASDIELARLARCERAAC